MRIRSLVSTGRMDLMVCILILAAVNLACMGMRKPWRDYSEKPFSSKDWLAGDRIERGRMITNIVRDRRSVDISTHEAVVRTFGEPDLKKKVEGREVWFYRIDVGAFEGMDLFPISFDEKGRGSVGMVRGDTISIGTKESEL